MPTKTQTTWTDTTDVICSTAAVRVKSVTIQRLPTATAVVYVQLYNSANATPGSTTASDIISAGFGDPEGTRVKVNFHGKKYGTGLTIFCSSDAGATAPLTVEIPSEVRVDWV
jgi:hypothetical protein